MANIGNYEEMYAPQEPASPAAANAEEIETGEGVCPKCKAPKWHECGCNTAQEIERELRDWIASWDDVDEPLRPNLEPLLRAADIIASLRARLDDLESRHDRHPQPCIIPVAAETDPC